MKIAGQKKLSVNYFYFGFLFAVLAVLHIFHISLIDHGNYSLQWYLVLDAIFQCFLEMATLIFIWNLLKDYSSKLISFIFVEITFLIFIAHLIDFPLMRIMGMSVWFGLGVVFQESFENFVEMLRVSSVTFEVWIYSAGIILLLLLSGLLFFCFTEKAMRKKPLLLSYTSFAKIFCMTSALLFFWDMAQPWFTGTGEDEAHYKSLPWKRTLLVPSQEVFTLSAPLKEPQTALALLPESFSLVTSKKPDIFLFVIESLREDFITSEVAPHFNQFKRENIAFDLALSNANATQNSWFSLFYSRYPFYYSYDRSLLKSGSPSIALLKKMGYEIHVYSSSPFSYYKMDELLFGKERHLADHFHEFAGDVRWKMDEKLMGELKLQVKESEGGGRVFLIFLDSTHFDYSWPMDESCPFTPIVDKINYLKMAFSKSDLEKIKNRYRNAIHYIDSLFGSFQETLQEAGRWDESLVVVTSDHGEEFYEQGHIFHASNLSHEQTHVPLYYKFAKSDFPLEAKCSMTSHMDIFPTLFHYLSGQNQFGNFFQGESVFKEDRWPFTVVARYNASRNPYEFFIHNGTYKVTARFNDEKKIFKATRLHLLSVKNLQDEPVSHTPSFIESEFGQALHSLFPP